MKLLTFTRETDKKMWQQRCDKAPHKWYWWFRGSRELQTTVMQERFWSTFAIAICRSASETLDNTEWENCPRILTREKHQWADNACAFVLHNIRYLPFSISTTKLSVSIALKDHIWFWYTAVFLFNVRAESATATFSAASAAINISVYATITHLIFFWAFFMHNIREKRFSFLFA